MWSKCFVYALLAAFLGGTAQHAAAQSSVSLPGCEASPEVQQALHNKLSTPEFGALSFDGRNALTQQVAAALAARYPRQLEPWRRLIAVAENEDDSHPEQLAGLQEKFLQEAKEHPDDPLMLYLAATVLRGKDTPKSVELDDRAIALAPEFAWPYAGLTWIYSGGKTVDKAKEQETLEKFWHLCPTSTDAFMRWELSKNLGLQAEVAAAERAYLAAATDPAVLKEYTFLWGLEFRITPPADYPALRKKIAADLARLETANPKPDAAWAAFLISGYKQSGAPQKVIAGKEDALLTDYPHSDQALEILEARWQDDHPQPANQADADAWKKWEAANLAATNQWLHDFPDAYHDLVQSAFFAAKADDAISQSDGLAAMNAYVKDTAEHWGPAPFMYAYAAEFLLDHNWQAAQALDLLERERELDAREDAVANANDNLSQKDIADATKNNWYRDTQLDGDLLLAAIRVDKPGAAAPIKAQVEGPVPSEIEHLSAYWQNRARLAALEGRRMDALAYYRLALQTRLEQPQFSDGKLEDQLGDEAYALWNQLGGSETAWASWRPNSSKQTANAAAARWEKPTEPLPAFSLSDLSGKTWTLADLRGKVVVINLWATWCGPCDAELPQLEKLYEQVKERRDIEILTFNLDEDPGMVEPFLKKKGYTFPVLPAYSYVMKLLNGFAIPQTWLLNGKGTWLWTQVGYGGDNAWQKDMLAKAESLESGD
ncbi:MAG: TlpA disulfide reductase family protein [Acidobacteriaceae bacterium]